MYWVADAGGGDGVSYALYLDKAEQGVGQVGEHGYAVDGEGIEEVAEDRGLRGYRSRRGEAIAEGLQVLDLRDVTLKLEGIVRNLKSFEVESCCINARVLCLRGTIICTSAPQVLQSGRG